MTEFEHAIAVNKALDLLFEQILKPFSVRCLTCADTGYVGTTDGIMFCPRGCHAKIQPITDLPVN